LTQIEARMEIPRKPIHQYSGYFIFDSPSQARYLKKNYKGSMIAYLKAPQHNNRIISYKFLKKLELMSLDILSTTTDKMPASLKLLENTKDIKKLALHHLIKEDIDLKRIYKVIKRCKYLTSIDLLTMNRAEKITDQGLGWLKKILKLTKNVRSLSFSGLRQNMKEVSIFKTFSIFPKLRFLQKVSLELQLAERCVNVLDTFCSILATCQNTRHISLNIKYYETVFDQTILDIFIPLTKVVYLREVSIYLGVYNYQMTEFNLLANSVSDFLEKNTLLENFSLDMRLGQSVSLDFPFEKAKNLKKLNLQLKESKCLSDKNCYGLISGISLCKSIQNLTLNLSRCMNLGDSSIESLGQALSNLKQLRTLELVLGSKIAANATLSGQSIRSLSESLAGLESLQELELSFSNLPQVSDQEVGILFGAILHLKILKELKLDLSFCKLSTFAFQGLQRTLGQLKALETFELDLYSCHQITNTFLAMLSACLLCEKDSLKNLQKAMFNLTGSLVEKSETTFCHSNLKKAYPKCYISFYIK